MGPEARSWLSWHTVDNVAKVPEVGSAAPNTAGLDLRPGRPAIITFLRHCGCPFAEQTLIRARDAALSHQDIDFIAISHSDAASTERWQRAVLGEKQTGDNLPDNLRISVDDELKLFAAWGIGASSYWHVLDPRSMMSVLRLQRDHNISVRPTESGSRWQKSGSFAIDHNRIVRWSRPATRADDVPSFEEAIACIESK
ncbi:hypothetical protein PYCC9005_001010 [Savitreella phatthalungensis]